MPVRMVIHPSSIDIPAGSPRREPPRPAHLRPLGYGERFDAETLYFDVFREGSSVVAVGPPLLNLVEESKSWRFATEGGSIRRPSVVQLDRSHRSVFRTAPNSSTLVVSDQQSQQSALIGPDLSSVFEGTRALMTLQLDNDLEWVRDWVRWHVRAQGTDAVVVYDNGSTRYGLEDVLDAISVEGIRVAAVVEWSFPYGPQGSDDLPWDSDFTQYGAIEHARRRLLRRAAGMLSVDVDELVYAVRNRTVYECAAASPQGFALFSGIWSYADPASTGSQVRHADCQWLRPDDADSPMKWCAVPSRLPQRSQLVVHGARGITTPPTSPISYWHMRPISTHWKVDRSMSSLEGAALVHSHLIEGQVGWFLLGSEGVDTHPIRPRTPPERVASFATLLGWKLRRLARRLLKRE